MVQSNWMFPLSDKAPLYKYESAFRPVEDQYACFYCETYGVTVYKIDVRPKMIARPALICKECLIDKLNEEIS